MYTLLLIDDDQEMLEITSASFRDSGYNVYISENARRGLDALVKISPDCIILDVMMPGMNGFEAFRRIRERTKVPVIFLTGRISEDDKVSGLLMGADDYIEKPFSFRELEARVRSALRRSALSTPGVLSFPPLEIDIVGHKALCDGEDLGLTTREYGLLYMLATSDGKVVTYEDIGNHIWGSYRSNDRSTVMVSMSRLRKKLDVNPIASNMIETVWTTGYKFIGKRAGL